MAACCRWPPTEARVQAIRAATLASVDWPRLLRIVRKHRIWGLVQDGLVTGPCSAPAEIAQELRAEAVALTQRNLVIAAEVLRPIIVVKGVSLSLLAYGDVQRPGDGADRGRTRRLFASDHGLHARLQELGWTVGRNVRLDYRWGIYDAERVRRGLQLQPPPAVAQIFIAPDSGRSRRHALRPPRASARD